MNTEKCKESVDGTGQWGSFHRHQCTKSIWKDGYCKIHHPESVKKRQKESAKRWEQTLEMSPMRQLQKANEKIKELEEKLAERMGK